MASQIRIITIFRYCNYTERNFFLGWLVTKITVLGVIAIVAVIVLVLVFSRRENGEFTS